MCEPIVRLLYQRGVFGAVATKMTAQALFYYSFGILGFGLIEVLTRVFYSMNDSKPPMYNGAFAVFVNIILNFSLVRYMGHRGLALATSISAFLSCIALLYRLKVKTGDIDMKHILRVLLKTICCSLIMAIGANRVYYLLLVFIKPGVISQAIALFSSIAFGGAIYLISMYMMRIEEVFSFYKYIKDAVR